MTDASTPPGWEYRGIQSAAATSKVEAMLDLVNDYGAEGWEMVSLSWADKTIGLNKMFAVLKRPLVPLDPPDDAEEGWKPDPSGRHDQRHWNGRAWTWWASDDGERVRDAPTQLEPTRGVGSR